MAKTKRNKKSKSDQISDELKIRIFSLIGIFIIIVSALKLGVIGENINYFLSYLVGNFVGILYALTIIFGCYVLYKAKLPKMTGPRAIGIYLSLIAILTIISINNDDNTGMQLINQYITNNSLNKGGLIGVILYGVLSTLFDKIGTIIASGIVLVIGLALLLSKTYFEYRKKTQPLRQPKKQRIKQASNTVTDFFTKKKDASKVLFPDSAFDSKEDSKSKQFSEKKKTKIHQMTPVEDEDATTKLEFNTDSMSLDIIEKEIKTKSNNDKDEKSINFSSTSNKSYRLPPITLLKNIGIKKIGDNKNFALDNADRLTEVLREFGVNATISDIFIGPTVTKYELKLETGTRVNKIMQLQDDIKLALASKDIRIEAPIPGKAAVGVEIPNHEASMVTFKEVFKDIPKDLQSNKLVVPLGKDISGKCTVAQLDKMPHLLIAGATGSGKSVCVNTIICSILMRAKPDEVKLILVDPKKVELSNYNGIPHLLAPVVTDPKKAAATLREVVSEMERRYDLFAKNNVRNISGYNTFANKKNQQLEENDQIEVLPFIVVILDEVADLMMVASKDVEDCIMRIAQMARAAGIHLIVATQRPSTDIITGVIKANIPSRIAFAVSSSIDSRTILDTSGAEKLLGKGDMLFSPMGSSSPIRIQGAFVSDDEVEAITYYSKQQQEVKYDERFENVKPTDSKSSSNEDNNDEEYEMCRAFVIQEQKASTSLLQRRFRIGYNKAARIIDQLENDGVIGPQTGSKPREVYIRGYDDSIE